MNSVHRGNCGHSVNQRQLRKCEVTTDPKRSSGVQRIHISQCLESLTGVDSSDYWTIAAVVQDEVQTVTTATTVHKFFTFCTFYTV